MKGGAVGKQEPGEACRDSVFLPLLLLLALDEHVEAARQTVMQTARQPCIAPDAQSTAFT